jgi:low affinity Fe/Cu permease
MNHKKSKRAAAERSRSNLDVHQAHFARTRDRASSRSNPFRRFAQATSTAMGKPWAFCAAALMIVLWALTGPLFAFSDTWQLVVNTSTTIVTFLMVFLIQNTQNRDTEALRLKLDELILATASARNEFVTIEDLSDEELKALEQELRARCEEPEPD